jgi:hypothetical protein
MKMDVHEFRGNHLLTWAVKYVLRSCVNFIGTYLLIWSGEDGTIVNVMRYIVVVVGVVKYREF